MRGLSTVSRLRSTLAFLVICAWTASSFGQNHDSTFHRARAWTVPSGVAFGDLRRLKSLPVVSRNDTDTTPSVCVATMAVGLNFADVFTILGYYKAANQVRGKELSAFIPGLEFSGVVMEDCEDFVRGDRVFGFIRFGAYSDIVEACPSHLRKLPTNWTFEEGAAFLVNALTAWHGLVTVAGMPNLSNSTDADPFVVVVHSAAGGVGLWASEIAARRGAVVVGIVGHESKVPIFYKRILPLCPSATCFVRRENRHEFQHGLASAICRARSHASSLPEPSWRHPKELPKIGWGCDVLMESYGGFYFSACMDMMNAGGTIATFGATTYNGDASDTRLPVIPLIWKYLRRPMIDPGILTNRNLRIGGFNLIFLTERTQALSRALDDCIACLSGKDDRSVDALESVTPPVVGQVYNFEHDAVKALTALRSGKTVGKVVLSNANNPVAIGNDIVKDSKTSLVDQESSTLDPFKDTTFWRILQS